MLIIKKEKSLIFIKETYERTPLNYEKINSNNIKVIFIKMINDNESNVNYLDEEYMTPL